MTKKLYKMRLYPIVDNDEVVVNQLLSSCFSYGDKLLLLCHREDSLLFLDEVLELRERVPIELQKVGQYRIIDFKDNVRFSSVAQIIYSEYSLNAIRMAWTYFYSIVICKTELSFQDITLKGLNLFLPDILCEKKVKTKEVNYCCIKGLDSDEFFLTFLGGDNELSTLREKLESSFEITLLG